MKFRKKFYISVLITGWIWLNYHGWYCPNSIFIANKPTHDLHGLLDTFHAINLVVTCAAVVIISITTTINVGSWIHDKLGEIED